MWAEQAIFTSLTRLGKSGYHVVSKSPGVSDSDAVQLATWSPSHGALVTDAANRTSVNFHPMPGGRFTLSRTCEGPPEYSGRGGRQLYTHALVFDTAKLRHAQYQPFTVYRDALALGYLHYRHEPEPVLKPVRLSSTYRQRNAQEWAGRARELGLPDLAPLRDQLASGREIKYAFAGDRATLAECLVGQLDPDLVSEISFTTSLQPSAVRPYQLVLVGAGA